MLTSYILLEFVIDAASRGERFQVLVVSDRLIVSSVDVKE